MNNERLANAELVPDQFRVLGHRLVDDLADFLAGLSQRPVAPDTTPRALRSLIGGDAGVPREGSDPAALIGEATRLVTEHSTLNGHPRFFGYITASAAPIGALADLLAATVNPN